LWVRLDSSLLNIPSQTKLMHKVVNNEYYEFGHTEVCYFVIVKKGRPFIPGKHFQASLIIVGNAGFQVVKHTKSD